MKWSPVVGKCRRSIVGKSDRIVGWEDELCHYNRYHDRDGSDTEEMVHGEHAHLVNFGCGLGLITFVTGVLDERNVSTNGRGEFKFKTPFHSSLVGRFLSIDGSSSRRISSLAGACSSVPAENGASATLRTMGSFIYLKMSKHRTSIKSAVVFVAYLIVSNQINSLSRRRTWRSVVEQAAWILQHLAALVGDSQLSGKALCRVKSGEIKRWV